jgi:TetR/AcrR family transcriptional regulator, transcriptional repressor for nem operon
VPRPRSFDQDVVLDAAMRAFWVAGYEATSTEQLCAATGLLRGSLYNAFTSKHDLFLAALERYMAQRAARLAEALDDGRSVRDAVAALLCDAADGDPDDPVGCLVVNATTELGPVDDVVAAALDRDRRRQADALADALAAGQRAGEICSTRSPVDLAQYVITTIGGLRVAARGGLDRDTRRAIADTALDAL